MSTEAKLRELIDRLDAQYDRISRAADAAQSSNSKATLKTIAATLAILIVELRATLDD